ncbi:glycoside hydrolase superfamily [Lactarius quietus]|nr:glycoside hydrolase superfamily [Lactarius quietus]
MLVGFFSFLLLAFAVPSFSAPTPRSPASAYNITRNDNLAVYWGQDGSGNQQDISTYCKDSTVDNIIIAFLDVFYGQGGQPEINLANTCSSSGDSVFEGTNLADCSFMTSQIETCQKNGKIVTLSLGGADSTPGFSSDAQAQAYADQIWNIFLGGWSSTRPFGTAVLDGVDLDIEKGSPSGYAAFVNQIRARAKGASKQYYVTAAPQCVFPDANIGAALNEAPFDAVYVQFYNNYCGLNQPHKYNFDTWDKWAKTQSANKDIKVYIGAPASKDAASTGYVELSTLANYAKQAQNDFSSFGGVMLWDVSMAVANDNFHQSIKSSLVAGAPPEPSGIPESQTPPTPTNTKPPKRSKLHTSTHPPTSTEPPTITFPIPPAIPTMNPFPPDILIP